MSDEQIKITSAGEIQIDEVILIANIAQDRGSVTIEMDLRAAFAELNIFEDLFSSSLYGNILISDANNLIEQLSIYGLEGLRIDVRTPGLSDNQRIRKTFGIYAITEQETLHNDRLQIYRLHFCSNELLADAFTKPLNRPIPAKDDNVDENATDLVSFLFAKYFVRFGGRSIPRNLIAKDGDPTKDGVSDLVLGAAGYDYKENATQSSEYRNVYTGEKASTSNKIKFIAPNWTPLKCINWIANRAVPSDKGKGGTFLFYESNKAFHFASVDALIWDKSTIETFFYEYTPASLQAPDNPSDQYALDVDKQMKRVLKFEFVKAFNILEQQQNGYFGQEVRTIDPIMKRYREHQYSYDSHYKDFEHTDNWVGKMFPNSPAWLLGSENTLIDPRRHITRRFRHPYFLFDDEVTPLANHAQWLAQRTARMSSLSNFTLNLLVYGRTDMKVGTTIAFSYPNMRSKKEIDDVTDKYLTGVYLVTAVRHSISPVSHRMTLEVMKDAFAESTVDTESTTPELTYDS
jgi:hypothetical protein